MTDAKTFQIRTGPKPSDRREHPFEESFEMFGQVWVVHRRLWGIGYALSHQETGRRVPNSERGRAVESRYHGTQFLVENQTKIEAILEKAGLYESNERS